MIDCKELLKDLQTLLRKEIEPDLRQRSELPEIEKELKAEFEKAKKAKRTALNYTDWRSDYITQIGVAWILSTVFIRFLEDNKLIDPPRLSGPTGGSDQSSVISSQEENTENRQLKTENSLQRARDEYDLYIRANPTHSFRQYILSVVDDLAKLSGGKEVFGKNNLIHQQRDWLSNDAAKALYNFWQKIDPATGRLIHDFTDDAPAGQPFDTRFLGDLYQDLSEAARKKYALLQTPDFVEEFILDRTLEPALDEFGLLVSTPTAEADNQQQKTENYFKMIDPACGSGHFLLGAFDRILDRWQRKEPGTKVDKLVERTLAAIHGVDINPFAVAIARFRLLLAAFRACHVERLDQPIDFHINVVCGDSLYHGKHRQLMLEGIESDESHYFRTENADELNRILREGTYHAVVANPPYITPKDQAQNDAYRRLYSSCHRTYALTVPFMERILRLSYRSEGRTSAAGFSGQITSNSFMKAEFGKKMVEEFFPSVELTHVIDTSGAYIPGHGTPTVILFARNQRPKTLKIRTVLGVEGEPERPADPAAGKVWTAILAQIDDAPSESRFASSLDSDRRLFIKHPWSIGGGGASQLKERIESLNPLPLKNYIEEIGRTTVTGEEEAWALDSQTARRQSLFSNTVPFVVGDSVRDWVIDDLPAVIYPYDGLGGTPLEFDSGQPVFRHLWLFRTQLQKRTVFSKTLADMGRPWWEHLEHYRKKLRYPRSITFPFVSTHNHYVFDEGAKLFNRPAPVIKLRRNASRKDHFHLLGILNSSTACFLLKQVCHNKGSTVDAHGARQRTSPFEDFYGYNGTKVKQLRIPQEFATDYGELISEKAKYLRLARPQNCLLACKDSASIDLDEYQRVFTSVLNLLIGSQEDLDWECYRLYGLIEEDLCYRKSAVCSKEESNAEDSFGIKLGERAFEIVMARKMAAGELQTTWFERHGSTPITEIPEHWPEDYKALVRRRIEVIESNPNIALIEQPEYKRRWNTEPWNSQVQRALKSWLLDRLESYFDFDGRMKEPEAEQTADESSPGAESPTSLADGQGESPPPLADIRVVSVAQLADVAAKDKRFMEVAQVYRDRADFDVVKLVDELVSEEHVPALPILRYKPSGLDKRREWEQTWELQRAEDRIHALVQAACTNALTEEAQTKQASDKPGDPSSHRIVVDKLDFAELANIIVASRHERKSDDKSPEPATVVQQRIDHAVRGIAEPKVSDVARLVTLEILGEIPVPPKYASADFISSGGARYWNLRGKLDVPKERWVSFPHCQGEDQTLPIAWAGYDHLQLTRAIAAYFAEVQERGGSDDPRLVPLLAAMDQQIPWVKQWHNDIDPDFGLRLGDYFENFINDEARNLGLTVEDIRKWTPPEKTKAKKKTKKSAKKTSAETD